MKKCFVVFGFTQLFVLGIALSLQAQELGPGFTKVKDGIYTFAPDATTTTCSFVVTQEGVVMIDSCNSPLDSRKMLAAVKKVTDKPIVFLIDTETTVITPRIILYFRPQPRSSTMRARGPR